MKKMNKIPLGNCLIVLIGPAGAGKSTFCETHFGADEVVSTDAIRLELTGDKRRQDMDFYVFQEFDHRIRTRLGLGLRAVADATHIFDQKRKRTAFLGKEMGVPVYYVIINRTMEQKIKSAGWRDGVFMESGASLLQGMEDTFVANEQKILSGDGDLADGIIDTRKGVEFLDRVPRYDVDKYLVTRGFTNIRVIGDVHGNLPGLEKVISTASEGTFFLFLGDVVDYGADTLVTAARVGDLINEGRAISLRGNHERKIVSWILGERNPDGFKGNVSGGNLVTTNQLKAMNNEERRVAEQKILGLVAESPDWLVIGKYLFAHAAVLPSMWENRIFRAIPKTTEEVFAMFGETSGNKIGGYPERLYNWVAKIEAGKTAVVGHAIRNAEPLITNNGIGGRAIFLDTGSSKTIKPSLMLPEEREHVHEEAPGRLSWMDLGLRETKKGVTIDFNGFGHEHQ